MRLFLVKLLIKLLQPYEFTVKYNKEVMEEWLISLASEQSGYKSYYTIRKKAIQDSMQLGISEKEYWANCGRLMELKQMNALASELLKKQDQEGKKKEKV